MSDIDPRMAAPPDQPPGAIRLTFLYDGDGIRLLSRQAVDVVVPPADATRRPGDGSFWVEVRTESEDVLYRRVMTDPAHIDPDVFSDNASAAGAAPEPPVGAFTVLVPDDEAASHVVLLGSPPRDSTTSRVAASRETPTREIARFPIHNPEAAPPGP